MIGEVYYIVRNKRTQEPLRRRHGPHLAEGPAIYTKQRRALQAIGIRREITAPDEWEVIPVRIEPIK